MKKLKLRPQWNFPRWGNNILVKLGIEFQSSVSRSCAHSTSAILPPSCARISCYLATFTLLLISHTWSHDFSRKTKQPQKSKGTTFSFSQLLSLFITYAFSESKRRPENGTHSICLQGTLEQTDLELSSTMTEQISLENRAISTPSNRRNKMHSLTMESLLVSYCKTL